jgi:hypothetical protein
MNCKIGISCRSGSEALERSHVRSSFEPSMLTCAGDRNKIDTFRLKS